MRTAGSVTPVTVKPFGTLRAQLSALMTAVNRTMVVIACATTITPVAAVVVSAAVVAAITAATTSLAAAPVALSVMLMAAVTAVTHFRTAHRRLIG